MALKIAVTREYEDEKRHVLSNRLLLILLQKRLTASSDIFLTFGGYAPDWPMSLTEELIYVVVYKIDSFWN